MRAWALSLLVMAGPVAADSPAELAEACGGVRVDVVLVPVVGEMVVSAEATAAAAEVLADRMPGPRLFGRALTSEVVVTGQGRLTLWRAGAADLGVDPAVLFAGGGPMAVYDVRAVGQAAGAGEILMQDAAGDAYVLAERPVIDDLGVESAGAIMDYAGRPAIGIQLDPIGARAFGEITAERIGQPLAIVHDGVVLTAPTVQSPIYGGALQITGNFAQAEAEGLAASLMSAALSHEVEVVNMVELTGTGGAACTDVLSGAGDAAD